MNTRESPDQRAMAASAPSGSGPAVGGWSSLTTEFKPVGGVGLAREAGRLAGLRLLMIHDHQSLEGHTLGRKLEADGARVTAVDSGEAALQLLDRNDFDVAVLDMRLRGMSGFETLRYVRGRSDVPVILMTDFNAPADRVGAFDLGADDYLRKPVEASELGRRVRALLRRSRGSDGRIVEELEGPDGLLLRLRSHEARVGDVAVDLTPKEFAVLRLLLERRGEVISPDDLSLTIWGYETFGSRNFVEAHISRLRAKLTKGGAPPIVTTIRGVGYVIR